LRRIAAIRRNIPRSVVFSDADRCAQAIVDRVGYDLRLAVRVSIGKPILIVDALYRLAEADRRVQLTIFTGLTLTLPCPRSSLERRFAEPLLDRLFSGCVEPLYAAAVRQSRLPSNIRVHEFFLLAGQSLANRLAQKSYISLNYSQVARHLERVETNVLTQLVAPHPTAARVSLSSNPDITLDMLPCVASRRAHEPTVFAVELNENLPYMPGEAEIERAQIDMVLEPADPHYGLFTPPKEPVSLADYAMALHAASASAHSRTRWRMRWCCVTETTPPSAAFSTSLARPFRFGLRSFWALTAAAIVVDILYFVGGVRWLGFVNYLFVWSAAKLALEIGLEGGQFVSALAYAGSEGWLTDAPRRGLTSLTRAGAAIARR
jgi:hypothetical protein